MAMLVLLVCVAAAAVSTWMAWPHLKGQKLLLAVMATLSMIGIVAANRFVGREVAGGVPYGSFTVVSLLACAGVLLYAGRSLIALPGALWRRFQLYREERRDPVRRGRREMIGLYESGLSLFADPHYRGAHERLANLGTAIVLGQIDADGIAALAQHLNARFHDGKADTSLIAEFLQDEKRRIADNFDLYPHHIVRMERRMGELAPVASE